VEKGVACDLVELILSEVFCLGWELRELVGEFYRRAVVFGCRVVVMEQMPHDSRCDKGRGPIVGDDGGGGCVAKGVWGGGSALQNGVWGGGSAHGGGACMFGGHG
jgi:hypothetical protein